MTVNLRSPSTRAEKRDRFAAAALTGILSSWTGNDYPAESGAAAKAFIFAKEMLVESEEAEQYDEIHNS